MNKTNLKTLRRLLKNSRAAFNAWLAHDTSVAKIDASDTADLDLGRFAAEHLTDDWLRDYERQAAENITLKANNERLIEETHNWSAAEKCDKLAHQQEVDGLKAIIDRAESMLENGFALDAIPAHFNGHATRLEAMIHEAWKSEIKYRDFPTPPTNG